MRALKTQQHDLVENGSGSVHVQAGVPQEPVALRGIAGDRVEGEQTGTEEILDIMDGIGDVVGDVHDVGFKRWNARFRIGHRCPGEHEVRSFGVIVAPFRASMPRIVLGNGILQDRVQGSGGQVQAG